MLESQLEKWIMSHAEKPVPVAVVFPSGQRVALGESVRVVLHLKNLSAVRSIFNPTLASLGTAYVEGDIDIDGELEDVIGVAVGLSQAAGGEDFVESSPGLFAKLRAHTRRRDKESIEYHYDVSNEFYKLFLDRSMVYSCGYFKSAEDSLDDAQTNKLDHILNKLMLNTTDRLLDVGCGWGALIMRAAERGARAVGVTLSQCQFDYARGEIARRGLGDRCEVRLQDYRDLPESECFTKIASVGMFEHVGVKNLPIYFAKMRALLCDGGAMLMHGITATQPDRREVGRGGGEFIDRYVFPDGELPHVTFVMRCMADAGLEVVDAESLRRHYGITLGHWARRIEANSAAAIRSAGERRFRIWRVYLAGCAFGFANNWMNIYQILACKLGAADANPFPLTREWMYRGQNAR